MAEKKNDVKKLFLETLEKLGCPYTLDEEDDAISFDFQGERFVAWLKDDYYIEIWDFHWMDHELYDIDNISRLKKVINDANMICGVTTVYTIDKASSCFGIHCTSTIVFISQIPNIEGYLKANLLQYFDTHRYITLEVGKLKQEEERNQSE